MSSTLSAENEYALEGLLAGIDANENRLGIFVAVCDDPQLKQEIIERYEQELKPTFRCYRLMLDREEPRLKGLIAEQVAADDDLQPGDMAVMTILGSERLFSLRLGEERSQQEKFFGYLQWTREGLRDYPFAIVLWVTYQMQAQLARKAPDFWSWRQDVVRFISPKQNEIPANRLVLGDSFDLDLPEAGGNGLPADDLEALIADTERQNPQSAMLASLHTQAGEARARRLKSGAVKDYREEINNAVEHLETARRMQASSEQTAQDANRLAWLASLYESQGQYEKAESLYLQVLELRQAQLGQDHPDIATDLDNLAGLYRSQGQYEKAKPLYLQALALRQEQLGEEHPNVATSLHNLAGLYWSQGRYEEAESLYLEDLGLSQKLLGEEHPDVATSLHNLAGLYWSQGRYEEAESLYLQDLELSRRLLGEEHPDVATSLHNLAALYFAIARYEEAASLFVKALAIREAALPPMHPYTVSTQNWLKATRSHLMPSTADE